VIAHCFLESWMAERDPLYVFLPLAVAGFATAIIFGVQWSVVIFPVRDEGSKEHESLSKGASQ
jgi:hypothetical protein